ncbi:unnamed protein product [Brassica rapa subsp. narinosa]|uniref:Uncharacterized protein n=1 Tax=Brassica campestris TaxID=3711 RepID=M4FIG8_BRACM
MEMPSTHLSVKELHTVSCGEIRNLIKWRKNFGSVVLIMFCSGQLLLYGQIFKNTVFCVIYIFQTSIDPSAQTVSVCCRCLVCMESFSGTESWIMLRQDVNSDFYSVHAELCKKNIGTMTVNFQVNYKEATKKSQCSS